MWGIFNYLDHIYYSEYKQEQEDRCMVSKMCETKTQKVHLSVPFG